MSPAVRRYLLLEQGVGAAVFNLVLNAAIAWAMFRSVAVVPLWGQQSIMGDTIGTCFLLPLLTCLIATRLVRSHVRAGKVAALGWTRTSHPVLGWLPETPARRGRDPGAHHADPARGIGKGREHLGLERRIERRAVAFVLIRGAGRAVADRPAVDAVLARLGPPAVEDRQVQPAVQGRLHARGAARFERPDGIVQPHVGAARQQAGEPHVVVGHEDDAVGVAAPR